MSKPQSPSLNADPNTISALYRVFSQNISDPRNPIYIQYDMGIFLVVLLLARLAGLTEAIKIKQYWEQHRKELEEILNDPDASQVPSSQTIRRLQTILNTEELEKFYAGYFTIGKDSDSQESEPLQKRHIIGYDGQNLNGCNISIVDPDNPDSIKQIQQYDIVSFFDCSNKICLAQTTVEKKNQEAAVLSKMLELVDVNGSIVTWDAINTRPGTVQQIIDAGADYLVCVKHNQSLLVEAAETAFNSQDQIFIQDNLISGDEIIYGHGRLEHKQIYILPADCVLDKELARKWKSVNSVIMVRTSKSFIRAGESTQPTTEDRYYISSLVPDTTEPNYAKSILHAIIARWGIETAHNRIDLLFGQDGLMLRNPKYVKNQSFFTKMALSIIGNVREALPYVRSNIKPTYTAISACCGYDPAAAVALARAYFNHDLSYIYEQDIFYRFDVLPKKDEPKDDSERELREHPAPEIFPGDSPLEKYMRARRNKKR